MGKNKKNKEKKKKKNIPFIISAILFVSAGIGMCFYLLSLKKQEEEFEELRSKITVSTDMEGDGSESSAAQGLDYYLIDGVVVQKEFKDLYLENSDTIGWVKAEDTTIDYPVVFKKGDEEYYSHKNFNKEYSFNGCIFGGGATDIVTPSENIIIYGHHIVGKRMFGALDFYEDEQYYKNHKYITFDTLRQTGKYEVIAVFRTKINTGDKKAFQYYEYTNMGKKDFNEYIENIKKLTPYNIPTTAEYGDQLLTLSTCAYHTSNGRFVVVAKRIEGNEVDLSKKPIEEIKTEK